jgi:hypothetical protein
MAERRDTIANADDIAREIAALKGRLITLDRERSEIADRLSALERVQIEGTAKQRPSLLPA